MKPKRILIVRHGQSEANADQIVHSTTPDHKINLTPQGQIDAMQAGHEIKELIGDEKVWAYVSPFYRTRQTYDGIATVIKDNIMKKLEDPRLREQEWGHLRSDFDNKYIVQKRDDYGTFYYRFPDGESGTDVYDRMSMFLETMFRDFKKCEFPENALIVSHGFTSRVFLMRWFHWTPEEFEDLRNLKNGQVVVMELQDNDRYKIVSTLRRYSDEADVQDKG